MPNLAETVKKQTDRILRQRALNGTEGVVVSGVAIGGLAPPPDINNIRAEVDAVKIKGKPVSISSFVGTNGYVLAYDENNAQWYLKADEGEGGGSSFSSFLRPDKDFYFFAAEIISSGIDGPP